MNKKILFIFVGVILIAGFFLRKHELTRWPREGATFDEFAWSFQGLSLLTKGIPTSWSHYGVNKNSVFYINPHGAPFTLITPYLEHPPLFGLVAGGYAYINGARSFDDINLEKIRPLALLMGMISIICVFVLTRAIYGDYVGLLAAGIFSITPSIAVGSRLVQNENFFIPIFLLALYFIYRYIHETTYTLFSVNLIAASLFSAIAPLAKIPWMAAPLAVVGICMYFKKWKAALVIVGTVVLFFSGYFLYGYMLDKKVFMDYWIFQLARSEMSFESLFILFRDPIIADRLFIDGWIYFGWAAIVLLMHNPDKKNIFITLGFLAYTAVFVFAVPGEPQRGWYRYPFYPFLTIASAVFIRKYFNTNYFLTALFLIIVGSSQLGTSWGRLYGFSFPIFRGYLAAVAFGALPGLFPELSGKKIFRVVNWMLFLCVIILSMWSIYLYNEQ